MNPPTTNQLERENEALRRQLGEAEQALHALRTGQVDAVLVQAGQEQVFTLEAADHPYRLLVERVPQAAATLTLDGIILSCNLRLSELLGLPRNALPGRSFESLVTPDSVPLLAALFQEGQLRGEGRGEVSLQPATGAPVRLYLGVTAVPEGAFGLCLMVTDLTQERHYRELRETQAALRASEERYRTLFESIDEGFCVVEVDFDDGGRPVDYRFLEVNPRFEHLTGLQNAVGKSMRQLQPQHEEYWFEVYGRVARTGVPIRFQNQAEALGRWYDVYAFPAGPPEERKVAILFNDITASKLAEERLRQQTAQFETLLYNAPLAVYLVDGNFRLRAVNPAARKLFGDVPDPVGRNLEDVAHLIWSPSRADEVIARFQHTLATGEPHSVPEWVEEHRGGPAEYHEWQINRIPLPEGGAGVVCYARNISSHVRARQALRASEHALKEADRRKDEFLAMLAHELRNPLAPIRNAVQLLITKGPPEPDLQWAREIIARQVTVMARLLEDLLDVSRISRHRLELRPESVELAAVVRTALETSRPLIEERGHQLNVELPPGPIRLRGDPVRLAQVFANLLNNAAKFTEPGGHIWLTARREEGEIQVAVRDTGIGISSEMLSHVFELYSQDNASAGAYTREGLGIGLSLAKGLVEMHGGRIAAQSDGPGRGSEFIVRLPLAAGETARPAEADSTPSPSIGVRHRILVADDNRDSADTLALLLTAMGNEVRVAYDGEQALQAAKELRPDVVLLDVEMPRLDGHATCGRLREQPWGRNTFMIAMSGWGQEADRRKAGEAGFDHHLVKPISPDALASLLASLPTRMR